MEKDLNESGHSLLGSVVKMAKPIEYVTELTEEEAREFLKVFENPRPNPARDKTIASALSKREIFRRIK